MHFVAMYEMCKRVTVICMKLMLMKMMFEKYWPVFLLLCDNHAVCGIPTVYALDRISSLINVTFS